MPNLSPYFSRQWNEEEESLEESLDESEFEDEGAAPKVARIKNVPQRLQQLPQSSAVTPPPPPHYNIEVGSPQWPALVKGAARYVALENAFPNVADASLSCKKQLQLIFGGTFEPDRPISPTLDGHYFRMISIQRTQLHSAVNNWLAGYTFPGCDFPADVSSRIEIYRYMVEDHRFARKNYKLDGKYLYSRCIIDCIVSVLVCGRGIKKLNPCPRLISKECIALITLMILYRLGKKIGDMEKQEGEKITDDAAGGPSNAVNEDSGGTKGKRTVQKDEFKWDSFWDRAYRDMLSSTGELGKYISWLPVQKWVHEHIERARLKASNAERSVAELFAGVIRQEELQAHQPYSMASEAPEADIVRTQAKPVKRRRMN
ncbi:hypothetical protein BJV82DRAFT_718784 [Fennellomyces sp. T-0311]|nr:hypothetical protein BJV82DRAFT_718784 [Fennellomyces sp. T-0311]